MLSFCWWRQFVLNPATYIEGVLFFNLGLLTRFSPVPFSLSVDSSLEGCWRNSGVARGQFSTRLVKYLNFPLPLQKFSPMNLPMKVTMILQPTLGTLPKMFLNNMCL